MQDAASLQTAIKEKYGIVAALVESHGGAFEVIVDGKKIFSKLKTFRFPENEEILSKLANMGAA